MIVEVGFLDRTFGTLEALPDGTMALSGNIPTLRNILSTWDETRTAKEFLVYLVHCRSGMSWARALTQAEVSFVAFLGADSGDAAE